MGSGKDCIVMDFFSGSATMAQAVMQLNVEDGGHRRFIMVQLQEETGEKTAAFKAGYKTINSRVGSKLAELSQYDFRWVIR
jgi:adenine-specific DNA-methyltransferase